MQACAPKLPPDVLFLARSRQTRRRSLKSASFLANNSNRPRPHTPSNEDHDQSFLRTALGASVLMAGALLYGVPNKPNVAVPRTPFAAISTAAAPSTAPSSAPTSSTSLSSPTSAAPSAPAAAASGPASSNYREEVPSTPLGPAPSDPAPAEDAYVYRYMSPLEAFDHWLAGVRAEAAARGVTEATLEIAFDRITPPSEVLKQGYKPPPPERLPKTEDEAPPDPAPAAPADEQPSALTMERRQPELLLSVREYVMALVPARVWDGVDALIEHRELLEGIHRAYGVPPEILVALWGVESCFGNYMGEYIVVDSLAHLAYLADSLDRQTFFRSELMVALEILDQGHVEIEDYIGSWAGALGQPQFMPTSFQAYAVDWDKDGRRDIWGSTADSLASIANYLKENGWKRGRAYGFPVSIDQPIATESESEPVSGAAAAKAGSDQGEAEQSVDSLWPWERWSMGLGAFGVGGESSPSAPSPIGASKDVKAKPLPELYHGDVKRFRDWRHVPGVHVASTLENANLYIEPDLAKNAHISARVSPSSHLTLIRPADGFAFLAGPNYEVIKTYNRSTPFAVAVATLANEIHMRAPL